MEYFRKLFKDKGSKLTVNIAVIFILGIAMIVFSGSLFKKETENSWQAESSAKEEVQESYEQTLERRLEEALSQAEGVGMVKVLITLAESSEIVVCEDVSSDESKTVEEDSAGGSRQTETSRSDSKTVLVQKNGASEPLIIKNIEPRIEGIIIIAEGGGDIVVKDMLMRSCQSLLGVEIHKIQVLKMK